MLESGFSIEIPRAGGQVEYVEFGYPPRTRTAGPLASVRGPFRFASHDAYECLTACGKEIVIFHLRSGQELKEDEEAGEAYSMLTGDRP